jgi:DNA helicase-2/ATP-dependent DNA helicase PcrA
LFLAGDDDQTIYEWAGAKPEYFLNMEGNVVDEMPQLWKDKTGYWDSDGVYILDQSWRMPNEILRLAKMCIEKVSERQEKRIKPHHEGGTFIPLQSPSVETVLKHVDFDDTYMLFRAKYQINNFSKQLIEKGIPYVDTRFVNTNYGGVWNKDMIDLRDGLRAIMRREDTMTGQQAARIVEELPANALKDDRKTLMSTLGSRKQIPTQSLVDVVSYGWPSGDNGILKWCMEFEEANWFQENAVRNNLRHGHEDMYPDGFKLGTIHSSKGREAGTIVLSLDSADPIMENMPPSGINDAERRLYYVGMTRTKDKLVMVEDLDSDSPNFTIDTLLGRQWRDDYEYQRPELEGEALADD